MSYQGQNYMFKHYRIVVWCFLHVLFCDKITSHIPIYNITMENMGHRIGSDRFDDEIIESL